MVLTQSHIDAVSQGLQIAPGSGYLTKAAVLRHTLDPEDTDEDLSAQGYVDGYEHLYYDPAAPVGLTLTSRVYLWNAADSAKAFLQLQVDDAQRLLGIQFPGGFTLKVFQELDSSIPVEDVQAFRVTATTASGREQLVSTVILWRRGLVVAAIGALAFDNEDRSDLVEQLSQMMNQRIDGVLAGQVRATPFVPAPLPTPAPATPQGAAPPPPLEEADLAVMLLTLEDLPVGSAIRSDGLLGTSVASQAYVRSFVPVDSAVTLGSSQVTEVRTAIGVYSDHRFARLPVQMVRSLAQEDLGQLFPKSLAKTGESAPISSTIQRLDLPQVGEASVAIRIDITTEQGNVEAYVVYFARGRVGAQLLVVGPAGHLSVEDVVPLARLFDQRVRENQP